MSCNHLRTNLTVLALWLLACPLHLFAQASSSGVTTGNAQNYAVCRTVGMVDPKAPVVFEDITAQTEVGKFRHRSGDPAMNYIIDSPSGGVAIFDYDGDGLPDIYLVNGATIPALRGQEKAPTSSPSTWATSPSPATTGATNRRRSTPCSSRSTTRRRRPAAPSCWATRRS